MAKKDKNKQVEIAEVKEETMVSEVEAAPEVEAAEAVGEVQSPVEAVSEAEAPVAKQHKEKKAKKKSGAAGFVAGEIILAVVSLPVLVALVVVASLGISAEAASYSFWPFIGAIIVAVLAIVVLIVALVGKRKSNAKTIRTQTVILCIVTFCLTIGLGCIFDVVLPDVLAKLASNTVRYETLENDYKTQVDLNASLAREFIRYSMFNGTYYEDEAKKAPYEYSALLENEKIGGDETTVGSIAYYQAMDAKKFNAIIDGYKAADEKNDKALFTSQMSFDYELYSFVYNWYVLGDYTYSFTGIEFDMETGAVGGLQARQAVAVAITEYAKNAHATLCKQGIDKNERLNKLFKDAASSMDRNSYAVLNDDAMLGYATSNRMTVPVIVRLLLNENYCYTTEVAATDDYDFEFDGKYFKGYGIQMWDAASSDYVTVPVQWSVLDVNGMSAPIAIELGSAYALLDSLGFAAALDIVMGALGGLDDGLSGLLNIELPAVIAAATKTNDYGTIASANLTVVPKLTDEGNLTIVVMSNNVSRGHLGYMQQSWVGLNGALFAIMDVVAARNFLFIFGATSVAMIFAAGLCREYAKKKKEEDADEAKSEDAPKDGAVEEAIA